MAAIQETGDRSQPDDDSYSIIEKLADAIRIEDDVQISAEERAVLVRDLFEGPRQCECCINWVDEAPTNVDLDATDEEEETHPIILRRRVLPGETGNSKVKAPVHSVEIRSPEVRQALFDVFSGLDGLHPDVKFLTFLAPFRQFFWRWEAFEKAVAEQKDDKVKEVLVQLRSIVKRELAEAFAVSKELTSNGVITFRYLWTIFPPGELVFRPVAGQERFLMIVNSRMAGYPPPAPPGRPYYYLNCRYVDWDGYNFGWLPSHGHIYTFQGTRPIKSLPWYPARYMDDQAGARDRCIARGVKFRDLAGIQYKSYISNDKLEERGDPGSRTKTLDRRIVLDARGHPDQTFGETLREPDKLLYSTDLIKQAPIDTAPSGGHRPLGAPPEAPRQHRGPPRQMADHYPPRGPNWAGYPLQADPRRPRGGRPPPPPGVRPPGRNQYDQPDETLATEEFGASKPRSAGLFVI